MKEEMNTTKPARAKDLASLLRNPLVIYGLIFLAGDGPLLCAYLLTSDPVHKDILLWALLVFIFGMGFVFCYLNIFKPRHFYAPGEIPETAMGRSIYSDSDLMAGLLTMAADKSDKKPEFPSEGFLTTLINNLGENTCRYLLKVANKSIDVEKHIVIIAQQIEGHFSQHIDSSYGPTIALGFFLGLLNFRGLLFEVHMHEAKMQLEISPKVIQLIEQSL